MHQLIAHEAAKHLLEDRSRRANEALAHPRLSPVRKRRVRKALGYRLVRVGARLTDTAGLVRAVTASCSGVVVIDGNSPRR